MKKVDARNKDGGEKYLERIDKRKKKKHNYLH